MIVGSLTGPQVFTYNPGSGPSDVPGCTDSSALVTTIYLLLLIMVLVSMHQKTLIVLVIVLVIQIAQVNVEVVLHWMSVMFVTEITHHVLIVWCS